jgi:hypothetical protein
MRLNVIKDFSQRVLIQAALRRSKNVNSAR